MPLWGGGGYGTGQSAAGVGAGQGYSGKPGIYNPGAYPRISGDAGAPAGVPGTVGDPYGRYGGFGQSGLDLRRALGLGFGGVRGRLGGGFYGGLGGGGYGAGGGMNAYRRAPGWGGGGAGIYGGQGKAPMFNPFLSGF